MDVSMTTTKKFDSFIATPLQDNSDLRCVPGVGDVALQKLKAANIDTAEQLVGHFMLLKRDVPRMVSWLKDVCEVRAQEANKIAEALDRKASRIVAL